MTTHTSGAADLPAIISGALFDFAGFLTTLDKSRAVTFSGAHEAGPAVTLLQEWSTKRGLNLDEADVSGWRSALTAQAISAEPAGAGYAAWPEPEVHDEGGWHITYYTATMMRDFADRTHALRASHGQAPAQPVDFTTLGAAMRAIQQAIGLIGDPADERMQAVRRVLRGAVVVAEDSGDIPAQPDCLTCNDHGAVGNILTAEPCPDCTPTPQAAPAEAADRCQACIDRHDGFYGSWAPDCPRHNCDGTPRSAALVEAQQPAPSAQAEVIDLIGKLVQAESNKTRTHQEYMGKAMPDDVYARFQRLRDETIPALRTQLLDALATSPQPSPTPQASHGQAPSHVLHLVQDAFAEVAMAYPKAFALHKVGLADTAVRKALPTPTPQAADSVLYDPKSVLDVFNSARAGSEKPVGYLRGILAVIAHWENRPEPHRWMVPARADSVLEDAARDHIRALIAQHADILEQNESAYFELCYHRATGWMAWITDKPLCMPPVINPGRTVLAQGQGDTPDEACADAARKQRGAT